MGYICFCQTHIDRLAGASIFYSLFGLIFKPAFYALVRRIDLKMPRKVKDVKADEPRIPA